MRDDDEAPTTSAEAVDACAHASWHRLFSEHAVPSESLPLPPAFVDFLLSDGVSLASDSGAVRRAPRSPSLFSRRQLPLRARADPLDDSAFTPEEEADEAGCSPPRFPELEAAVAAAIARLGGAVLPKLNWSAPKDAVWLTLDGRLRCTNADEVFLLLKASDTIAHELCHAYAHCVAPPAQTPAQPELVLKKWLSLRPALEFRCFVWGSELAGACQRHPGLHFPFLAEQRGELRARLLRFFEDAVADVFPQPHYTFDVALLPSGGVRLLDFNPWGGATLPLLFSWAELGAAAAGEEPPELRVVEEAQLIRPGLRTGVPLDLYATGEGSALAQFVERQQQEERKRGGEQREEEEAEEEAAAVQ